MKNRLSRLSLMFPLLGACSAKANVNLMHTPIRNAELQHLSNDTVARTAFKAINDLSPYFANYEKDENYVLSPSSYLLAVAGLASATDNFNNSQFGLNADASSDVGELLNAWNFEYDEKENGDYCFFKSAILHQQVGERYAFDDKKREEFNKEHISTMVSSLGSYLSDAQYFFKDEIGLDLQIPDMNLKNDSVVAYGGIKMKDYVADGLNAKDNQFKTYDGKEITVSSYSFGNQKYGKVISYYKGDNYQVFSVNISLTSLLIVLPDENVNVTDIDVSDAYKKYIDEGESKTAYGYIPFFHAKTEGEYITEALTNKLTGEEAFYSKLLRDYVVNDLSVSSVIQSSDFEFNEYGVSGESITVIALEGSAAPVEATPIEINVNRPFYAVSLKDDFPIFVSMVLDPSQSV